MHTQIILVTVLFMNGVLTSPFYDPALVEERKPEETQTSFQVGRNPMQMKNDIKESSDSSAAQAKGKDLMAQETFYPGGGVWWGVRPWGGWGGYYRPWYGWHGWHGWHGPHYGGHWGGGHWGRPWGGHWVGRQST